VDELSNMTRASKHCPRADRSKSARSNKTRGTVVVELILACRGEVDYGSLLTNVPLPMSILTSALTLSWDARRVLETTEERARAWRAATGNVPACTVQGRGLGQCGS
jgi:hypothetical protein